MRRRPLGASAASSDLRRPTSSNSSSGPVAFHPLFKNSNVVRLVHVAHGNLVRTPIVFALLAVDLLRTRPSLRRAENDHRPGRPFQIAPVPGLGPDPLDLGHRSVERAGQLLVHLCGIVPLDEVGRVAHALEELLQFLLGNAGEEARVGDLVAVEVEDREHTPVAGRIKELVAVPAGREWAGFGLAVANDAGDDQVGIVEGRAIGMAQGVSKLAAFVNTAGRFRRDVARNTAGKAELLEQPLHALRVLADVGIEFAVGPFQIGVRNQRRASMPWPDDVNHVEVVALDDPVEVNIEHVQSRRGAPMSEKTRFDVIALQWFAQQGVVEKVDLPDREIVRCSPIGIDETKLPDRSEVSRPFLYCPASYFPFLQPQPQTSNSPPEVYTEAFPNKPSPMGRQPQI